MRGDNTPYGVLGGMIDYRVQHMPWSRQSRLRVTEFITDTPLYTIRSSKDIPEWKIRDILDSIHPDWKLDEYYPTPSSTDKQLRALCYKFSQEIVAKIKTPEDYATLQEVTEAALSLTSEVIS